MNVLVTVKLPLPFERATGKVFHVEGPVSAISALPSPLKSPTNFLACGSEDKLAKSPMNVLVTVKLPLPFERATGKVFHDEGPVSAISALPSPLKSPTNFLACRLEAKPAKSEIGRLVTLKLPSPFEKATGSVFQPETPVRAMSVLPSPLKSPVNTVTCGLVAQMAKSPTKLLVTVKPFSPFEKAI